MDSALTEKNKLLTDVTVYVKKDIDGLKLMVFGLPKFIHCPMHIFHCFNEYSFGETIKVIYQLNAKN